MGKEDRRLAVLEFMADHGLALPPKAIFRNLRFHRKITFSYSSVDNYLEEFVEEGLVSRIEPAPLANRELVEVNSDTGSRAYYIITEKGREYLAESLS